MPIPKPGSTEDKDKFMSRCMSDPTMVKEYDKSQRYAICQRQWDDRHKKDITMIEKAITHNSTLADSEPSWSSVDKTSLPYQAFAAGDPDKKSTWSFPHHFIKNGTMYLHKGGLNAAWAAAQGARSGQKASPEVIAHLKKHRDVLDEEKSLAIPDRKDMIRKTFAYDVKSFEEESNYFRFKGYASVFNSVDWYGDTILPGAFSRFLKDYDAGEHLVPIFFGHNPDMAIGIPEVLREDDYGLYIEGVLPLDDTLVKGRIVPQMKIGSIRRMSIAFTSMDEEKKEAKGKFFKEAFLWECSLVPLPAERKAEVTEFKSMDVYDLKSLTPRQLEEQLTSGLKMSNQAARDFISLIKDRLQWDAESQQWDAALGDRLKSLANYDLQRKLDKVKNWRC